LGNPPVTPTMPVVMGHDIYGAAVCSMRMDVYSWIAMFPIQPVLDVVGKIMVNMPKIHRRYFRRNP
jgi:hypothetical protein